ncbi:chromate resistance protein ChrB domain-containing protein [Foetidibacter luteolus]|uniref:chromate resistance protein ChrB domain-containing protein n=1 Tax=Foetidibacter luteolus TaxID=2608880 RepID=UPI00129A5B5D|nr:chromate resistance protein ChrB domain-containing protein [Foetidibacter luteolus]
MKWITREHPKIDRIACPWLIKKFIDPGAEIIYAPFNEVLLKAEQLSATPFDIPGVEHTHYGDDCTFDYFIKKYNITDAGVLAMAPIVRGADTDHHELSVHAPGLWAISAGLAHNFNDDNELLEKGMLIYDALYSWATHLQNVKHTQQPFESLLLNALVRIIKSQGGQEGQIPGWAVELKEMIQDHIDTNITLTELSRDLDINRSYLSREFSRHFDNMSFGEYIRKQRIEKAISLMADVKLSLTDIAYLTGFSDQSHFTRIFKKHTRQSPSAYRKKISKK